MVGDIEGKRRGKEGGAASRREESLKLKGRFIKRWASLEGDGGLQRKEE